MISLKKQIILTIITGVILAFLIYKITYNEEMNFVSLGDGVSLGLTAYNVKGYSFNDYLKDYFEDNTILREYIFEFSTVDETSKSLLTKITNNETLENSSLTIQQAISKAKVITLSLGMDELNNLKSLKTKDINNYLTNMSKILNLIRNINKNQIFLISLYQSEKLDEEQIAKINKELEQIANNYHITFIDITKAAENKNYYLIPHNYYLNYKGHKFISELIKNKL